MPGRHLADATLSASKEVPMKKKKVLAATALSASLAAGGLIGATLGTPGTSGAASNQATTTTTAPGSGSGSSTGDHGPGRRGPGGPFDLTVAAKALGMSEADLRTALQGGKSLADVAKDKGVDKAKLIDALVKAAEDRLAQQKAALPERITALVDGTIPAGGPGGRGGSGGFGDHDGRRGSFDLTAAAKALGLSEADLRTALQGGKSLADVAKDKGVDKAKVVEALVASAKERLATEVKDGELTQAQADERAKDLPTRIAALVDGTGGKGFGRGGPGGHRPGG